MAQMLEGWDTLAEFMGLSRRTAIKMKPELEDAGVLLYKRKGRARRRVAFSYDVLLLAFMREKFSEKKNE